MSRFDANLNASADVEIRFGNVDIGFDHCMKHKAHHGQCLKELAGPDIPLRSNHGLQLQCLTATNSDASQILKCPEWRTCLKSSLGYGVIVKVLGGLSMYSGVSLQEIHSRTNPSSTDCQEDLDHHSCVYPSTSDVEAFVCHCYKEIANKSATEINAFACAHSAVCSGWKNCHCPPPWGTALSAQENGNLVQTKSLLGARRSIADETEDQMDIAKSGAMGSLDNALTGKCIP